MAKHMRLARSAITQMLANSRSPYRHQQWRGETALASSQAAESAGGIAEQRVKWDYRGQRKAVPLGPWVPDIAVDAYVAPNAVVCGQVEVQDSSSIWYGSVLRGDLNKIFVGFCSNVQEKCVLHAAPSSPTALKELFRLHLTAPVLLPHRAESSCEIEGFVIPKDSQVIVNARAIGRDPKIWSNPSEFVPERFLEGEKRNIDYKGKDFELIDSIRSGKKNLSGHSFEWELPNGLGGELLDVTYIMDKFGVTFK